MSRIRVVVTAEDIAAGIPRFGDKCPVARAVRRGGFPDAHVAAMRWYPGDETPSIRLTDAVISWIERFDSGKTVQPRTFYLEGPDR